MKIPTTSKSDTDKRLIAGEPVRVAVMKYAKSLSGDGARIIIQLVYFYLVANALTIGNFGLFATASSIGIVLSRLLAFGFTSPLYRIATVKPQLVGTYTSGFLGLGVLSLPVIAAVGFVIYSLFFTNLMVLGVFALIVATEVLFWRGLELVIIINRGLERFGLASIVIVFGYAMKALAAAIFAFGDDFSLARWAMIYCTTQALMVVIAIGLFYPKQKLRWHTGIYARRMRDALAVCGADILFYVQSELDKLVVLTFGGEVAAGIYAMVMRLVDLTATPVRVFSAILSQRLMRYPGLIDTLKIRSLLEIMVFAVSTTGLVAMAGALWIKPDLLGDNVATAGSFLFVVLMVPAFRNLIEYHAELLYGRGQSGIKLINYALIGATKALLMVWMLTEFSTPSEWFILTNAVFGTLYAISFMLTYSAMRRPAIRV